MNQEFSRTHWIWVIPAMPMMLMLLLVAVASLFSYGGRGDPYFMVGLGIGGLAILVGLAMLATLLILLVRHKISFAQPRLWLSLALSFLDVAIPVGIVLFFLYIIKQLAH